MTPMLLAKTYLALGSNLGNREAYLRAAVAGLSRYAIHPTLCASIYLTEPRDTADQPWFLNTVVEATTALEPEPLLDACLAVERLNHRVRGDWKGPRTIDIDIILYSNKIVDTSRLTVPHARYAERRFVLEPLVEIAPELVDPIRLRTVRELLAEIQDTGVVRQTAGPLFHNVAKTTF